MPVYAAHFQILFCCYNIGETYPEQHLPHPAESLAEGVESPTVLGAKIANSLLDINGVKASFVLTKYNGKIYISARSIDELNVQVMMERLGGGGHINMAGAQLKDMSMEEAKAIIRETIDNMITEGEA